MPGRVPHWPVREALQVLVPLSEQVEHVGPDQRDADAALPAALIPADAAASVVIHNTCTQVGGADHWSSITLIIDHCLAAGKSELKSVSAAWEDHVCLR